MLISEYLPEETSRVMLRGVDAIVLPYRDTGESSSAALRFLLPLERPIVVTDQPIFADCRDWVLAVDPTDPVLMHEALRRVLTDDRFKSDLASRARAGANKLRWSRIISDHREIYCASRHAHRAPSPRDLKT
jgi:glycosyltransferase involved in cell wall biosynthesis